MRYFLFFFLTLQISQASVKDSIYDELEGIPLAEALLRDGKIDEAKRFAESSNWPFSEKQEFLGRLELDRNDWEKAKFHFGSALEKSTSIDFSRKIHSGLARANFELKAPSHCHSHAELTGQEMLRAESLAIIRALCAPKQLAFKNWMEAYELFPNAPVLFGWMEFLLDNGLVQYAKEKSYERVKQKVTASEPLGLSKIFYERGWKQEALEILEIAKILYPKDSDILLALAPLYHAHGWKSATTDLFEKVAYADAKFSTHAAEMNRELGNKMRSLWFQPLIEEDKERIRQKLATYVESEQWELVSSLDPIVKRSQLESDNEVSYALSYSMARMGNFARAREYLTQIRDSSISKKVNTLWKIVLGCASSAKNASDARCSVE